MMKKIIALFLLFSLIFSHTALAAESNVDGGGGGGMGGGSGGNKWSPGNDGVRVTLVDAKTGWRKSRSVDLTNKNIPQDIIHFGAEYKSHYARINTNTNPRFGNYDCRNPYIPMPTIISSASGGASDIAQIRSYFASEGVLQDIAIYLDVGYEFMISGDYKLLLEPLAYFHYNGTMFAMTATEAACYDALIGGGLRSKLVSLTHRNLPLSMFLEQSDLSYPAWAGSTSTAQNNATIISKLGLGIIYFKEQELEPPVIGTGDFTYHTDTDVITTLYITAEGTYTPDEGGRVTFSVGGKTYTKPFICPGGGRQMVWFKWRTPSTPQTMTISLSGNVITGTLTANIVERIEEEPPDPKYADSAGNFELQSTPSGPSKLSTEWYEWDAEWIPPVDEDDEGYWSFYVNNYSASLDIEYDLLPADRVPTGVNLGFGDWQMKSGYGTVANVDVQVSGQGGVSSADITPVQHIEATFSEFGFETYNRFLIPENNAYSTVWHFKPNRYSYYNDAVHFSPLWYPDDTDYMVPLAIMDAWTPGGELRASVSDRVSIQGTAYNDWYIRKK